MPIQNAIAGLAVRDLKLSARWYERLLGRAPDSRPMPNLAEWQFDRGGWLQIYQLPDRAGKGSVTLSVSDLEEQIGYLYRCGIEAGQPMQTGKVKAVMIKDPDGNSIAFTEATDPNIAQ